MKFFELLFKLSPERKAPKMVRNKIKKMEKIKKIAERRERIRLEDKLRKKIADYKLKKGIL